jgi:hypothetical protein
MTMLHNESAGPNLKALRNILYSLFAAAAICFAICIALILHAGPQRQQTIRPRPVPCHCQGECMRPRTRPVSGGTP